MSSLSYRDNVVSLAQVIAASPHIALGRRAEPGWVDVLIPSEGPAFREGAPPCAIRRERWKIRLALRGELMPETTVEANPPGWHDTLSAHQFAYGPMPISVNQLVLRNRCPELSDPAPDEEALLFFDGSARPGAPLERTLGVLGSARDEAKVRALLPRPPELKPWWRFW